MPKVTKARVLSESLSLIHAKLSATAWDGTRLKALLDLVIAYLPYFIKLFGGTTITQDAATYEADSLKIFCEIQNDLRTSPLSPGERMQYLALCKMSLTHLCETIDIPD
jgi:hypothetical protein